MGLGPLARPVPGAGLRWRLPGAEGALLGPGRGPHGPGGAQRATRGGRAAGDAAAHGGRRGWKEYGTWWEYRVWDGSPICFGCGQSPT